MYKYLIVGLLSVILFGTPGTARAAGQVCSDMALEDSGEIRGTGRSIGFIVGIRWGVGTVKMNDGRSFKFRAKGLKPLEMGASEVEFAGRVFNLKNPKDFEGIYGGVATGLTVVKGFGGAAFQNGNCVTVQIKRTGAKGIQGSFPMLTGIHVELME